MKTGIWPTMPTLIKKRSTAGKVAGADPPVGLKGAERTATDGCRLYFARRLPMRAESSGLQSRRFTVGRANTAGCCRATGSGFGSWKKRTPSSRSR